MWVRTPPGRAIFKVKNVMTNDKNSYVVSDYNKRCLEEVIQNTPAPSRLEALHFVKGLIAKALPMWRQSIKDESALKRAENTYSVTLDYVNSLIKEEEDKITP